MKKSTINIILPISKTEVAIYEFITGREKRELNATMLSGISSKDGVKIENVHNREDALFKIMVPEMEIEAILDLDSRDYEFLKKAIDDQLDTDDEKKTN